MRRGKHTSRKASNGGAGASLDDDEAYEAFLVQLEHEPDSVSGAGRSRKDRRTMASRLVDSAVDSPDAMRALGYALRAVRLDPWHLDARVLLALAAKGPQSELIEELRTIAGAVEALRIARRQNPDAEPSLTGRKRMSKDRPEYLELGEGSEAEFCMDTIGRAWARHREAVQWVKKNST